MHVFHISSIIDSLYCGKWEKISKSNRDLDLDRTMPMSNSSKDFSYPTIYSNFKILDHLFFELSCLHTDRQTDRQRRQVLYTCGLNRKYNNCWSNRVLIEHWFLMLSFFCHKFENLGLKNKTFPCLTFLNKIHGFIKHHKYSPNP